MYKRGGVEVAIGSAAAISKVAISNEHCIYRDTSTACYPSLETWWSIQFFSELEKKSSWRGSKSHSLVSLSYTFFGMVPAYSLLIFGIFACRLQLKRKLGILIQCPCNEQRSLKNCIFKVSMPHYQKDNLGVMSYDELHYIVGQVKRQSNLLKFCF